MSGVVTVWDRLDKYYRIMAAGFFLISFLIAFHSLLFTGYFVNLDDNTHVFQNPFVLQEGWTVLVS